MSIFVSLISMVITIYFFYYKFGDKVGACTYFSGAINATPSIKSVTLFNYKDKPTVIFNLYLLINNDLLLLVREFKDPLILKPFEAKPIAIEPVSEYKLDNHIFILRPSHINPKNGRILYSTLGKTKKALIVYPEKLMNPITLKIFF